MEEYHKNEEMVQLFNQCKMAKIKFHIEVQAGPSSKLVALEAAKSFRATWVILDRQMKKDKKYFLEKLSCGISRMKRDNTIEKLRGPKAIDQNTKLPSGNCRPNAIDQNAKLPTGKCTTGYVTYGEMIPGNLQEEVSTKSTQNMDLGKEQGGDGSGVPLYANQRKLPISKSSSSEHIFSSSQGNFEASSSSCTKVISTAFHIQEEESNTETEQEMAGVREEGDQTKANNTNTGSPAELEHHRTGGGGGGGGYKSEVFKNSICSVCGNRRPKVGFKIEFTYAELHAATDGFSSKTFLSEGGFGSVYRGELKNGLKIAAKQHKDVSFQGEKEFKSEVHVLSKARHENLVMLLGSCSEGSHRLLVYEYVCNGSLDKHLSKHTETPLSWSNRIKIALGAAKGLEYLHRKNIIHRDVRPNNILVTHDHESLLGDFGLARTYEDSDNSDNKVVGTLGYLAPEYAESGKGSSKTDVYSFGVVLLQLITGLSTTDKMHEGKSLIEWAKPLLIEKNYPDLIDQRIVDSHDMHQLFWMVLVAEKCLSNDPRKRWTMRSVVNTLNNIIEGDNICIQDFSPTHSDSENSCKMVDSPRLIGSQGNANANAHTTDGTNYEHEEEKKLITTQVSSTIDDTTVQTSGPLSISFGRKTHEKRREKITTNKSELLYDEMVI